MENQKEKVLEAAPVENFENFKNKEIIESIQKLYEISKNSFNNINSLLNDYSNKNNAFFSDIKEYMEEVDSKSVENESKMDLDKNVKLLTKIIEIYSKIVDSINSNFEILFQFLDICKNLKKEPIQNFYSKEFKKIIDYWLSMKMDFERFDVKDDLKQSSLDDKSKDFISQTTKKKSVVINVNLPKVKAQDNNNKSEEIKKEQFKLLEDYKSNVETLNLSNVSAFSKYLGDKSQYEKLSNLYIENSEFGQGFIKRMPNLTSFTMKLCPNMPYDILDYLPEKLKHLNLEKNNYVNQDFQNIMNLLVAKNLFLENLESLSFCGNNLTKVDLSSAIPPKKSFKVLKKLNFNKNKIYKFICDPEKFPSLTFINCCNNNLNKSYLKDIKKFGSLESGNGFLFEPELCEEYYNKLKEKLKVNEKNLYLTDYLNITFIPRVFALKYFKDLIINEAITVQLRKLDLSYNSLDCETFFKFVSNNQQFESLTTLNLNGNELDDTFFEKLLKTNNFKNLEHLYLNSNKIGNPDITVGYKDNVPIEQKYSSAKDKQLIFKLRLIYLLIEKKSCLTKLTITKNPICDFYSIIPDRDADKSEKYIKKDNNNNIIINCLFSFLIKIRDELLPKEKEKNGRTTFNLRFDCRSNVNKNSDNYPYDEKPIVYKSK
jgi:hypothetical protein